MNAHQRLNEIRKKVAYIQKDKKVEGYMAVTHDAVTELVREWLIEFGILTVPTLLKSGNVLTGTSTGKGIPYIRQEAEYQIDFVNIDEPTDKVTVVLDAHALDHGDKAPGKTASYAVKTALLKLLSIVSGEGEEDRPEQSYERPESSKSTSQVAWESMSLKTQGDLEKISATAREYLEMSQPDEAMTYIKAQGLGPDEHSALWYLFNSKERSTLKSAKVTK